MDASVSSLRRLTRMMGVKRQRNEPPPLIRAIEYLAGPARYN
jgi:hypothetical protein